jgi:hypothetical protein
MGADRNGAGCLTLDLPHSYGIDRFFVRVGPVWKPANNNFGFKCSTTERHLQFLTSYWCFPIEQIFICPKFSLCNEFASLE